jgi:predicted RNA-binding protein with PUA-like domain
MHSSQMRTDCWRGDGLKETVRTTIQRSDNESEPQMSFWLLKTEPSSYSFADLQRDKRSAWTGVTNAAALIHMRNMRKGDLAFIYHTGDERQIVGIAEIVRDPYPDPDAENPKLVAVDLKPKRALKAPVTLVQIKDDGRFRNFDLVRNSRLSVMPVPAELESAILKMAGG